MVRRSEELRRRHKTILGWSIGGAVALHVLAFLLLPGLRTDPIIPPEIELEATPASGGALVDVRFGPPEISRADGSVFRESPDRVLQVVRLVRLPAGCGVLREAGPTSLAGRVALTVGPDGRADLVDIVEGTGHACADEVIASLADDLRYRWLPSDEFPAPVRLAQPVTIVETVRTVDAPQ